MLQRPDAAAVPVLPLPGAGAATASGPSAALEEGLDFEEFCEVRPRFGRVVALHRRSSTSCQIHEDNRCPYTYF